MSEVITMHSHCTWCDSKHIEEKKASVFWELPDGSRAIEITETPSILCHDCDMEYQPDEQVKEIEDQLFLIDTKTIDKEISFAELMARPRLLKRNYFDFSQLD